MSGKLLLHLYGIKNARCNHIIFPATISDLPRLEHLRFIEDVRSGFAQKVSYTPWVAYLFVREADG